MSPAKAEIQAQDPDVAAVNEHIGFDPEKEAGVIKKKVQEAGEGIKERVDAETQRLALSMDIAVGEKNLKKIREDLKAAEKVYGEVQGVIDLVKKEGGSKMALDMAIKDAEPAERKFR
ncbi:hypothetical protein KKA95_04140, partial [Patescibacteria group bacterium]|nr:hypothetical protein [Patescibacteria group bacterium]